MNENSSLLRARPNLESDPVLVLGFDDAGDAERLAHPENVLNRVVFDSIDANPEHRKEQPPAPPLAEGCGPGASAEAAASAGAHGGDRCGAFSLIPPRRASER